MTEFESAKSLIYGVLFIKIKNKNLQSFLKTAVVLEHMTIRSFVLYSSSIVCFCFVLILFFLVGPLAPSFQNSGIIVLGARVDKIAQVLCHQNVMTSKRVLHLPTSWWHS